MSKVHKGVRGREKAREAERRRFRAELLRLAREGKKEAAVTLMACLGHGDLIPLIDGKEHR